MPVCAWNLVAGWRGCKCVCSSGEGLCISNSVSGSNSVKTVRSKLRDYWAQGNTEFGQWSDHSKLAECWVLVTVLWLIVSNQNSYRKYAQNNYKIFSFSICLSFFLLCCEGVLTDALYFLMWRLVVKKKWYVCGTVPVPGHEGERQMFYGWEMFESH